MTAPTSPFIDVHLRPDDLRESLTTDVQKGLNSLPKDLPPKWFYDARGSELFDEITRLPEYYPTETERAILHEHAAHLVALAGASTLVELGAGSADKTRVLLSAMRDLGILRRYAPFDVSETALRRSAAAIAVQYPGTVVHAVVGDFDRHLHAIPRGGVRLFALLGGTIGNYPPVARKEFLQQLAAQMRPGDSFLLGVDLVKDVGRLIAAYDDAQGVTEAFNKNLLAVINRELDADFDLDRFDHIARWNADSEWIEMWLRSTERQHVSVRGLQLQVQFDRGEEMRTEISAKFRRAGVVAELEAAGLEPVEWVTDDAGDYALSLSVRR
jgi:L-histidine Nalpha-methyltransferase